MELTDNLHNMLYGDIKEGMTPRTQEYFFEVGVSPDLPPKIIAQTVKESQGNSLAFLFKIHEHLVAIETEQYEEAYWEAKSK